MTGNEYCGDKERNMASQEAEKMMKSMATRANVPYEYFTSQAVWGKFFDQLIKELIDQKK